VDAASRLLTTLPRCITAAFVQRSYATAPYDAAIDKQQQALTGSNRRTGVNR
jgi:hypothetical protein